MAEVRHISYRAEDVDAMAKFFVDAMGMTVVQKRKDNSIDLSPEVPSLANGRYRARRRWPSPAAENRDAKPLVTSRTA